MRKGKEEQTDMLWILMFAGLLLVGFASFIYLIRRVHRFHFVCTLAHGRSATEWIFSTVFVVLPAALSWFLWGYMNTIICLLHLVLFWLLCDAVCHRIQKNRKRTFRRYYAGMAAILLTITYLSAGWIQAHHVWQTNYTIETDKSVGNLRIALLADSHIGTTFHGNGFCEELKRIQAQEPDIVVVAGDFVDEDTTKSDMLISCQALGALQTTYGVYFVFGNHDKGNYANGERGYDGDELAAELEKNGVTVLEDEAVFIDDRFCLIGRQDLSEKLQFGGNRADMAVLTQKLDPEKFSIVLDHQPRDYTAQAETGVDLVLSGHTHGGQLFPLMQLMEWTGLGGNDSVYGRKHKDNTDFIVTSGISDWAIKFKTGCRSEYVIIDITGS